LAFAALASAHAQTPPDYTQIIEQVAPSVVNVVTERPAPPSPERGAKGPSDDLLSNLQAMRRIRPGPTRGSGFILSADGYVVTAASNVEGDEPILFKITLTDGRAFPAKRVGVDERTDIALLKIEVTGLRPVKFADASKLKLGQRVLLIGSAFAGENTVADGIVSQFSTRNPAATPRGLPVMPYVATTVPVQAGNGGAPFVDAKGEVIGFVTQMYVHPNNPFATISFGVLPDAIRSIAESLRTLGYVPRGAIRITIQEVTKELADALGMPAPRGALVNATQRGGPAERAGMAAGDIILQFNGQPVETSSDITRLVGGTRAGTRVPVQVLRKGALLSLEVEIEDDRTAGKNTQKAR